MTESPTPATGPRQADQLFALVYEELRRIARKRRRQAGSPATLDTTALINETYLKLASARESVGYSRAHFLSLAARAMRQVLVDHVRTRSRLKRGGNWATTTFGQGIEGGADVFDLVALDAVLSELAELDPRAGSVVELRVFGGLEIAEIARLQGIGERTVSRDWRRARAFLMQRLSSQSD